VLRNQQFRLYFCGSVISDLGTWWQNAAQVLLAYRLSHSVLVVGLVTCAQFSSPLVLSPFAGVFADRFGGRRTLLGTQVVAGLVAVALGYLDFSGGLNGWWLAAGALLSGLCFTFALPARNITVRRLVNDETEQVRPAFAMDSVSYNIGRAVAPVMTIALVHWVGFGWAFIGNSASFAIFTVVLWRVDRSGSAEPERRSRITDGFRIAKSDGTIIILLLMVAAVTIADDPVLVLGPALASRMNMSASSSGWFIAALGAGTVVGSLRRSKHLPSPRLAATALALLGGSMVFFVMTPWMLVSVAAAFCAGVSCLIANAMTRTLLSEVAGKDRVAAVMAIWAIAWAGSKPFASLADGLLAGWVGVRWTGIILAIPALIPIVVVVLMPSLGRKLASHGHALAGQSPGNPVGPPVGDLMAVGVPTLPAREGASEEALPVGRHTGPQPSLALSEGTIAGAATADQPSIDGSFCDLRSNSTQEAQLPLALSHLRGREARWPNPSSDRSPMI
jgi:MFS family permease